MHFETFQVDLGGIWSATKNLEFTLIGQVMLRPTRESKASIYAPTKPSESGLASFSGEGIYRQQMYKVGLTTHAKF